MPIINTTYISFQTTASSVKVTRLLLPVQKIQKQAYWIFHQPPTAVHREMFVGIHLNLAVKLIAMHSKQLLKKSRNIVKIRTSANCMQTMMNLVILALALTSIWKSSSDVETMVWFILNIVTILTPYSLHKIHCTRLTEKNAYK